MGTIKQDRKDLEMLLNGISPVASQSPSSTNTAAPVQQPQQTTTASVVDNSGSEMGVEKLFDYDPDALRKGLRKKSRKTILSIASHILTEDLLQEDYVQDKIEQDTETLTDLYVQLETNNLMQRALVTNVSRGNTMPRYFEVFGQLTEKIANINKQIIDTEQKLRKTYLDLKYEIRDRQEDEAALAGMNGNQNVLTTQPKQDNGLIITSSRDLIDRAKKRHREELDKAKETTYIEE